MATLAIRELLSIKPPDANVIGRYYDPKRTHRTVPTHGHYFCNTISSKVRNIVRNRFGSESPFLRLCNSTKWMEAGATYQSMRERKTQVLCILTEKIVGGSQLSTNAEPALRRLILLRHAKSSWTDRSLRDHDRPLSKRGRQAAANIAVKLHHYQGWLPQLILCSDSMRTRETLDVMQQQLYELAKAELRFLGSFYSIAAMDGQTAQHLQETICRYSTDDITTIMCMGHNRGWEEAASLFSGVHVELKTANAALLEANGCSWKETFDIAGFGGWRLVGLIKPDTIDVEGVLL